MVDRLARALVVASASAIVISASSQPSVFDPAQNLARVRVIVSTTATIADVTIGGAVIASYRPVVLAGGGSTGGSHTGSVMRLSNGAPGQPAEVQFDVILAGVQPSGDVTWNVSTTGSAAGATLDIYSLASFDAPRLVDRFSTAAASGQFTSRGSLLGPGAVAVATFGARLVLAHYYPWYTLDTWSDPQMLDRPETPYSTASQADVDAESTRAHAAGIDAFVVSWNGLDYEVHGTNDPRTRMVLDAARRAGMNACVYTETYAATAPGDPNGPPEPGTMLKWLEEITDLYGSHPAYLRVGSRPVIFIYSSWLISQADWIDLRARLRASGRDPFLVADFYHSRLIEVFDGEYQYSNVTLSRDQVLENDRIESLRVRTFDLLQPKDARRVWVASVAPGYDDTRIRARSTHVVVDRAGGAVYDGQWSAAITTASDWVIVTTWNEWWENTEIEPSQAYGTRYVDRTRAWATTFKTGNLRYRPPDAPVIGAARPRG